MSIPSGSDIQQSDETDQPVGPTDVPLASLPLVADHQKTVVTSGDLHTESSDTPDTLPLHPQRNPTEVLFQLNGSDTVPGEVRLAHFQIKRRIGSGGMGHVFLAEDVLLHRPVALKVLKPSTAGDTTLLARFHNEARCAALLRPENVAQIYFIGEDHGLHFIACEYISGRTVRDLIISEDTLSVERVLNYAIQTTLALSHMHAIGVVHRDIKPSNIIVSDEGRVKIVDLGLARRDTPDSVCDVTVAGSILGTFDYIAPEQARDPHQADIRSDIYSLGCTLYHMLTGQPPYPEGTAMQKIMDHHGRSAPDPAHINSRVPTAVADIVLTMLATSPEDRYQTPDELLIALLDAADDLGIQGVPADSVVWRRHNGPPARRQVGTFTILAAVCVLCATALAMHLSPSSTTSDPALTMKVPIAPLTADSDSADPGTAAGPVTADAGETENRTSAEQISTLLPVPAGVDPDEAFVVLSPNNDPQGYPTLEQAISQTLSTEQTGHRIMLMDSGSSPVVIRGLPRLDGGRIHLCAAQGAKPIIEFRGSDDESASTSLFRLINQSSLTLEGITLRLTPDSPDSDSRWNLFDCVGSTHLELRDCVIQVDVGQRAAAEVFRFNDSTSALGQRSVTSVECANLVVSGTTDMFHVATQTLGDFRLENCGFAIDGHLIKNTGSSSMGQSGELKFDLRHVTAITGLSTIRITEPVSTSRRMIATLEVSSQAGIFASAEGDGILVESDGEGKLAELAELFNWSGDTNLYGGISDFWILAPQDVDVPTRRSFDEWSEIWQRRSEYNDDDGYPFEWSSAAWKTGDGPADFRRFETSWFVVEPERFHTRQELPRFRDRTAPGVVIHRLPVADTSWVSDADDKESQESAPSL